MATGHFIGSLGRGLAAGLIGTAVMTAVQMIEMKARGRPASTTPAKAVEKTLAVEARDDAAEQRLSQLTHFAYGTAWGLARGLLGGLGVRAATATPVHLALVWGAALAMLPRLGLSSPVREWSKAEIAQDFAMHAVYAVATGAVFEWLEHRT